VKLIALSERSSQVILKQLEDVTAQGGLNIDWKRTRRCISIHNRIKLRDTSEKLHRILDAALNARILESQTCTSLVVNMKDKSERSRIDSLHDFLQIIARIADRYSEDISLKKVSNSITLHISYTNAHI
jgi:YesN/AraC family two-component response regulator